MNHDFTDIDDLDPTEPEVFKPTKRPGIGGRKESNKYNLWEKTKKPEEAKKLNAHRFVAALKAKRG